MHLRDEHHYAAQVRMASIPCAIRKLEVHTRGEAVFERVGYALQFGIRIDRGARQVDRYGQPPGIWREAPEACEAK